MSKQTNCDCHEVHIGKDCFGHPIIELSEEICQDILDNCPIIAKNIGLALLNSRCEYCDELVDYPLPIHQSCAKAWLRGYHAREDEYRRTN